MCRSPPEAERLGPDGITYDNGVKTYLVGDIDSKVEQEVSEKLGYKTRAFRFADPFVLSEHAMHGLRRFPGIIPTK